jgi:hypothetical protein
MAFNDLERKRIQKALDAFVNQLRPPEPIRAQLDYSYNLEGQSVELMEIRPQWDDPSIIHRRPYAKATFVRSQNAWKIYWLRQTLKWHSYEPVPTARTIDDFLKVVREDAYCCFFG